MALLEIKNLSVGFDTSAGQFMAVQGIDLSVDDREVLAIVGESGSGKSVAMLAVMGLLPKTATVTADSMTFDGHNMLTMTGKQRREIVGRDVAMIFQEPMASLNPCFTVGFQLEEVLRFHMKMDGQRHGASVRSNCFKQVGIPTPEERLNSFPHQMSGGQCQRVMIAIAIACNPKLLIADEPTTALDVTIQKQILDLLVSLQAKHGMGLIMITHDMGVVAETADRVIVQYKGRKMEEADVLSLFESPKSPYTRALLSALPENATGDRLSTVADFMKNEAANVRSGAMSEIVLEGRNIVRDYHVGGGLFGKQKTVHAVKGVSFTLGKGQNPCHRGRERLRKVNARTDIDADRSADFRRTFDRRQAYQYRQGSRHSRRCAARCRSFSRIPMVRSIRARRLVKCSANRLLFNTNKTAAERRDLAMQMLVKVGLGPEHYNRYPHMFSGGQRQRIAIARALMLSPSLLVLDEPVSALDLSVQAQVLNLLADLQDEFNLTYVFISHDLSVVRYIADEVMVMYYGEVVEYGTREEVFANPQHSYTKTLFAATPKSDVESIRHAWPRRRQPGCAA